MKWKRVWQLFLIDMRLMYRKILWVTLVLVFVLVVITLFMTWLRGIGMGFNGEEVWYLGWDMTLLGVAWCLLGSYAFSDLHHQKDGFYLLLPATQEEKFLSKLFATLVVYPVLGFVLLFVFSLLALLVVYYLTGMIVPVFLPRYGWLWQWWLFFAVLQAWCVWGGVYFSHLSFVKTFLLLFGVFFLVLFLSTPLLQVLFGTVVSLNGVVLYSTQGLIPESIAREIFVIFSIGGKLLFYASGVLAYWLAYRGLQRYEVTHGV